MRRIYNSEVCERAPLLVFLHCQVELKIAQAILAGVLTPPKTRHCRFGCGKMCNKLSWQAFTPPPPLPPHPPYRQCPSTRTTFQNWASLKRRKRLYLGSKERGNVWSGGQLEDYVHDDLSLMHSPLILRWCWKGELFSVSIQSCCLSVSLDILDFLHSLLHSFCNSSSFPLCLSSLERERNWIFVPNWLCCTFLVFSWNRSGLKPAGPHIRQLILDPVDFMFFFSCVCFISWIAKSVIVLFQSSNKLCLYIDSLQISE